MNDKSFKNLDVGDKIFFVRKGNGLKAIKVQVLEKSTFDVSWIYVLHRRKDYKFLATKETVFRTQKEASRQALKNIASVIKTNLKELDFINHKLKSLKKFAAQAKKGI